ncbi:MAG: hypothetical protein H0W53_20655 [Acidobacteria bacterium]|nr:hypothetical protein [Acidobacteriota bacterium]
MTGGPGRIGLAFLLCLVPFLVLATLNAGGYRYGASDQAFYQPAVTKQLDPSLFPRDTPVLAAQTHLTLADEVIAATVRTTGASIPSAFFALYIVALILFAGGVWLTGTHLYARTWTTIALLAATTLRHAIARSGTNTLEGYFQPRLLAYGLGAAAIAAFLRGRLVLVAVLLALGAIVHPTTALWFGVWLAAAALVHDRHLRPWGLAAAVAAGAAAAWALTAGPLAGRLAIMDPQWRAMLETKTYLFPLEWPLYAWLINLGYIPVIAWLFARRTAAGLAGDRERALVFGSSALLVVFLAALVCHAVGIALAFQLQPARVFWMFDFLATIYIVWALAEGYPAGRVSAWRPQTVALVFALFSIGRGLFVVVQAQRPPLQLEISDDDWGRVMAWARTTDKGSGWLADPLHAVYYGTSVRVAGERDVFVEAVKDAALGMYDRDIAVRTDERIRALPDFPGLTADGARTLGAEYGLDYLVTESTLGLPLAFESGRLRIYRLQ